MNDRTKRGVIIAGAVLCGLLFHTLALLLLVIAGLLIAWGQDPKRLEAFFQALPYGDKILSALATIDSMLS